MPRYIDADHMKTTKSIQSADFNSIETIQKWIDAQPTADVVERKRGEWLHTEMIDDDEDSGVNSDATRCSICGEYQSSYYWATTYYNYCPNCGADMRGDDD